MRRQPDRTGAGRRCRAMCRQEGEGASNGTRFAGAKCQGVGTRIDHSSRGLTPGGGRARRFASVRARCETACMSIVAAWPRCRGSRVYVNDGLRDGRSMLASGSVCVSIPTPISVVAVPTDHHRTPAPQSAHGRNACVARRRAPSTTHRESLPTTLALTHRTGLILKPISCGAVSRRIDGRTIAKKTEGSLPPFSLRRIRQMRSRTASTAYQ